MRRFHARDWLDTLDLTVTPDLKVGPTGVRALVAAMLVVVALVAAPAAAETVHLLVVVGLAGDPEHGELFDRWAATLVDGSERLGVSRDRIIYLSDRPERDPKRINGKSTREAIVGAFGKLAAKVAPDDVVFVMLIGNGTFDGRTAKFNLPGPDMSPSDFAPLLGKLPSKHVVLVDAAPSSAPFLNELAAPGRTIVTATRTGAERFATLFGGYFVDALTGDTADADKNHRVSVLEAFNAAKAEVPRAYEREGIMLTEHPLLDDVGDREGSAEPSADGKIGRLASVVSLGTVESAEPLTADPKLRALYLERRDLERRVEALKLLKGSIDQARYESELEKLLTDLALKGKQIRESGGREP